MRSWFAAGRRWSIKSRYTLRQLGARLRGRLLPQRPTLPLEYVQRRLDLMLTAMYGRPIQIATAEPETSHWLARLVRFARRDPSARETTPGVDGVMMASKSSNRWSIPAA